MLAWYVSWIKELLEVLGSGLDFEWRGTFPGQPFAISTNWGLWEENHGVANELDMTERLNNNESKA